MSKRAIYIDKTKLNYFVGSTEKLCNRLNGFIEILISQSFLQTSIDTAFVRELFDSRGANIVQAYEKHIQPYLEQSNELLRSVAQSNGNERKEELVKQVLQFVEDSYSLFRNYGSVDGAVMAIYYDPDNSIFKYDPTEIERQCTIYVDGDLSKLHERIEKCLSEIKSLDAECRSRSNNKLSLLHNNFGCGLIGADAYGTISTNFENFDLLM